MTLATQISLSEHKQCVKCGGMFAPNDLFPARRACKPCVKKQRHEYYLRTRQEHIQRARNYKQANPDRKREMDRKYRQSEGYAERHSKLTYANTKLYPEKKSARAALFNAIRSGKVVRPEKCSDCGCECKPHGHHEDYSKPLDVIWVCVICHASRHSKDHLNEESAWP